MVLPSKIDYFFVMLEEKETSRLKVSGLFRFILFSVIGDPPPSLIN